jgi:hypothetical protein
MTSLSLYVFQAVEEIRQTRAALAKEERRTRDLITEINKQARPLRRRTDARVYRTHACRGVHTRACVSYTRLAGGQGGGPA